MKPVSVRFKCFGPYMDEQFIDFTLLEKSGLFLICGETGSGKTTILDAMCYALYGRSSGGGRGELENMRCKLAGAKDETLVEFIFDAGGQRYKFTRSLKMARKNLNDNHNCLVLKDGVYVPLLENPKKMAVNAKAQELVGLTYDQFRQVIILPQGQFEKLLVSDSTEKEKILVSLFHAQQWQDIAEELYRRVDERDKALKTERTAVVNKLAEYGVKDLAGLEARLAEDRATLGALHEQVQAGERELARQKQALEAAMLVQKDFEALDTHERALRGLEQDAQRFAQTEARLVLADTAEGLRPVYDAYAAAHRAMTQAQKALESAQKGLHKTLAAEEAAQSARLRHEQGRGDYESMKGKRVMLENARELYRGLDARRKSAEEAASARSAAEQTMKRAESLFQREHTAWLTAMEAQETAAARYRRGQALYLDGIGYTLAMKLEEGKACPVCGSTDHPDPARPVGEQVTDSGLEELNQAQQRAAKQVSAAFSKRSAAETQRGEAQSALLEAKHRAAEAGAAYESALQQRIEGVDSLAGLEQTLLGLRRSIDEYEAAERRTAQTLTDAQGGRMAAESLLQSAQTAADTAGAARQEAFAAWTAALTDSGFGEEGAYLQAVMAPEERGRQQTALIRYRADLDHARQAVAEQREKLAEQVRPDVMGLRKAHAAGETALKDLRRRHDVAESRLELMGDTLRDLTVRMESYEARRQKVDGDLEFAKRLRGTTGVSLQRYVLGVMLTSITEAANRLLENVHGGRYRLYRTNEVAGSGHKSGLELEVFDARNNERRSVTTLSGGEKFLVALSLAIGLSTVVQAQGGGIRLEAMFIDEGFGSLDSSSIHDALEVLQGVRRGSGVVGIISHVEQLAETIPTQIHIIKTTQGSRCELRL